MIPSDDRTQAPDHAVTTPEAVADVVVRAVSANDTVVYAPGILRYVFGVFRLLPQAVWRRLPLS